MKVYGEIEVAQLEGFTTGTLPPASTNYRRIVFDTTVEKIKVSNGTIWKAAADIVPPFQYVIGTAGGSDFSTIAAALTAHPSNASFLLDNSYATSESVTITGSNILICGQGAVSVLTGNLTISAASQYVMVEKIKITGDITFTAGCSLNNITNCWAASTSAITDNGTSNNLLVIQA